MWFDNQLDGLNPKERKEKAGFIVGGITLFIAFISLMVWFKGKDL